MKIFLLQTCLFFTLMYAYSQDLSGNYVVLSNPESVLVSNIEKIDPMIFDLYRSPSVDNEVQIKLDGKIVKILLLSAQKLNEMGIPYDKGVVQKGALISGDAVNQPRKFVWEIDAKNQFTDITAY